MSIPRRRYRFENEHRGIVGVKKSFSPPTTPRQAAATKRFMSAGSPKSQSRKTSRVPDVLKSPVIRSLSSPITLVQILFLLHRPRVIRRPVSEAAMSAGAVQSAAERKDQTLKIRYKF